MSDDYTETEAEEGEGLASDQAYVTWLQERLSEAEAYTDSDIVADERQQAFDYYLRRPIGDERQGRSQVVSGDVYKVVEGVSTAIADIYCSNADAVQFTPRGEDDQEKAEQRTELVNYTFWTTCKGYLPLLESIKSGVHQKTGFLTWYWAPKKRLTREVYRNQTLDSLALLNDNDAVKDVQIIGQTMTPEGQMLDVQVDIVKDLGRIVVESIPPEHVKISPRAKSADTQAAPELFTIAFKTESDCRECGYTDEQIEEMDFSGSQWNDSIDRNVDRATQGEGQARIITAYCVVDRDGDGIVELHKTVFCGDVILSDDITDEINLSGWTPNIQPHEYFGRSPADDAIQAQRLNSTLWRQALDSLYHSTNPQWRIDQSDQRVNIEDFYSPEIGRPLRAPQGAAEPIALPYVGHQVFPMLEYSTSDTENLTGFTRYSQGLDAQSLNKTATGVRMITNMSQQRVKMMARNYGELCLAPCMRGISKLLSQHSERALSIRIRGRFVDIDPREWAEEYDMVVNVGLGSVDKEQEAMHLGVVAQAQQAAVTAGGLGKVVTLKNIYNVQKKMAALAGIKDPTFAWTDPDTVPPPTEPPPPPVEVQTKQMELQADAQKTQFQSQSDQQKHAADLADKQAQREHDAQLQMALAQLKEEAETNRQLLLEQMRLNHEAGMQAQTQAAETSAKEAGNSVSEMAGIAPAIAEALQMVAQGMSAMQQVAAVLAAPKQGTAVKNKDGTFSVITQPVIQ